MTIVVTGATGQLGRLVVGALLKRGARADDIVAIGRNTARIADLADAGVQVRRADYNEPESLRQAFADADRVLLISGSEVGARVPQHQNVIDAAKQVGVELLAYTSIAKADHTSVPLAADHQATERALADSGLPHTLLRNSWYLENYTAQLPTYVEHSAVLGSAGDGRISAATRADYAEAAAAVLLGADHAGKVYEFGGDESFTLAQLAAEVSRVTGREVVYRDLPVADYAQALVAAGLPEPYALSLANSDLGVARGDLHVISGDLARLIGRRTISMPRAVQESAAAAGLAI
jgi:NAD(P)H dehydrogenase (quinone)